VGVRFALLLLFTSAFAGCTAEPAVPPAPADLHEPVRTTPESTKAPTVGPTPTPSPSPRPSPAPSPTSAAPRASPPPAGGPVAKIDQSAEHVVVGSPVTLHARDSEDPAGGGLTYAWGLGDGSTSSNEQVVHTYDRDGTFTVRLTITDVNGRSSEATAQVTADSTTYEQAVWFNHDTTELDVLVLGAEDPVVGAAIQRGIEVWENGIAEMAPDLGLVLRVHWAQDGVPPSLDPHIVFVPQGFMAVYPVAARCVSTAPMMAGWGDPVHVAAHEFGHCLGLEHVFEAGEEYEPAMDIMGGGQSGHFSCPSDLNVHVLRMVFSGQTGNVEVPASGYRQASTC